MDTKEKVIKYVAIDSLTPAKFNPAKRVTGKSFGKLQASIKANGICQPLAVTKDSTVADGHRRLASAKALGFETVPVIVHQDVGVEKLWILANSTSQPVSLSQLFSAWHQGLNLDEEGFPTSPRAIIKAISETLTQKTIDRLFNEGRSPNVFAQGKSIVAYSGLKGSSENIDLAVNWILDHPVSMRIREYYAAGGSPALLKHLIENGFGLTKAHVREAVSLHEDTL